jgi:hypothetical protein
MPKRLLRVQSSVRFGRRMVYASIIRAPSIVEELMDTLSAAARPKECPKCGSRLRYVTIMFFSSTEERQNVAHPLACLREMRPHHRQAAICSSRRLLASSR